MLASTFEDIVALDASRPTLAQALAGMRRMSFDTFGELLLALPDPRLPYLSAVLPSATPDAVQEQWTGSSGETLLRQSLSFVNFLVAEYSAQSGRSIGDAQVLDFGVGWGRLMRLLAFFVDPPRLFGIDPWQISLDHALTARIPGNLARSEAEPDALPFDPIRFDLIFAFSVFTHIRVEAARKCLAAMRARIAPGGIAVISVRPVEFWSYLGTAQGADHSARMTEHRTSGISYMPLDAEGSYGDISMSREYLASIAPNWEIVRMGATMIDPYQMFVTLRPV